MSSISSIFSARRAHFNAAKGFTSWVAAVDVLAAACMPEWRCCRGAPNMHRYDDIHPNIFRAAGSRTCWRFMPALDKQPKHYQIIQKRFQPACAFQKWAPVLQYRFGARSNFAIARLLT
jgi:hypothetical protein